jgi:hypothetical protein
MNLAKHLNLHNTKLENLSHSWCILIKKDDFKIVLLL